MERKEKTFIKKRRIQLRGLSKGWFDKEQELEAKKSYASGSFWTVFYLYIFRMLFSQYVIFCCLSLRGTRYFQIGLRYGAEIFSICSYNLDLETKIKT